MVRYLARVSSVTRKRPDWEIVLKADAATGQMDFEAPAWKIPTDEKWKVKKDGGVFDQFTGATITPRKIVKAIHTALMYVDSNPGVFFDE